mmetsp:Transcript_56368/g.91234  ORF Transcript_56368/g.91234 Transcript_56368/m.91234 type:complete len:1164 (+) Transcript_56368:84-3575(+)
MSHEGADITEEVFNDDSEELEEEELEEEETNEAEAEAEEEAATALTEVQDKIFEEMRLPADTVAEVQGTWQAYLNTAISRDAAGDAIYGAIFDSAPSLQSLFKTPRAVMATRIMGGVNTIVNAMNTPAALKLTTETLGFQHLDLEVTDARVIIFRDAIVDLLEMELGGRFTSKAKSGWRSVLNYVGGAYIYIRREYSGRLKIISSSWATATKKTKDIMDVEAEEAEEAEGEGGEGANEAKGETETWMATGKDNSKSGMKQANASGEASSKKINNMVVPTTFNEMFMFNGAVMGFGNNLWMHEVLESFDAIVSNVANSYRLQEECDTLSLSLAKYHGQINLPEFKSVMLASLRSLVPKDWNSAHEVAWTWLWENVERMLKALIGKPAIQERALGRFIMSLTEDSQNYLKSEFYKRFFALAPGGQDHFKQSTTRLYWIAGKVTEMTIEMYRDPKKMAEDISALGLRHVGYGIPTEFFAPFVSGAVEVVRTMTTDEDAEDGYRWSLSLMSRMMVRTINEGATIVMKAINTNSKSQLEKAVACAPRGKRALWLLNITVGTQSISPLYWAIESGSVESAQAMITDLLTIRADRDNYYYGTDDLFGRHPDVIERLCADAQALLPGLLDGLIWRSRLTQRGQRRVNFYVKHLIQDSEGQLNQALEWLVDADDPKTMCHPAVVLFSDLLWERLASRYFLLGKCWFLFTLVLFVVSQSILQHLNEGEQKQETRTAIFALRCFIYVFSMGQLVRAQVLDAVRDVRANNFVMIAGCIRCPEYLSRWKNSVSLALLFCLMFMLTQEPIIWCLRNYDPNADSSAALLEEAASAEHVAASAAAASSEHVAASAGLRLLSAAAAVAASGAAVAASDAASVVVNHDGELFTQHCPSGDTNLQIYAPTCMVATLLYWTLIVDLTAFSTHISAFVLVCGRVVSELGLFLMSITFLILVFASSISALNHNMADFKGIPKAMLSLAEMTLGMYPTGHYDEMQEEPIVLVTVSIFTILGAVFLLNLLVAQLNGAYQTVHADMVGFARLNRGKLIVETMPAVSKKVWARWLANLGLDERMEFNEGDVGLAGGVQILEAANANPTNIDMIRRFGGSTSPAMLWPEEGGGDNEADKFERLEKVILRATKKMTGGGGRRGAGSSSMGSSMGTGQSSSDSGSSQGVGKL